MSVHRTSAGELAVPESDTWRQLGYTEGIAAMMKSLFYAFVLLPVVRSNGGNTYTTVFWALDRGCAVAVFMEWNKNIAPKWQSALFMFLLIMHFFPFCVKRREKKKKVLNIYWLCLSQVLTENKEYSCTTFPCTLSGLPKNIRALKLLFLVITVKVFPPIFIFSRLMI